jgi:hypothetical protein
VLGVLEIGGEAFLVPIDRMEEGALAFDPEIRDVELAADVTTLRAFNLDHAGSEIGESHGGCRACKKLTEVEDNETG